ncbi:MAG: amidohydrolase family protein [Acidobacteria bacterium]|nr:amidohydrolase family protein [Acidobacteriota bacterium]
MSIKNILALFLAPFFLIALSSRAQIPPELISYPDAVLFSGKILTFDGPLMNERPIFHKAMAIRDGKVFAVGTDEQIVKLKGPTTLAIDLRGKTVLPGFVDNHNHPHEWIHYFRYDSFLPNVKLIFVPGPDDKITENRPDIFYGWGPVLKNPPMEIVQNLEARLRKAAAELGPGQDKWILVTLTRQGMNLMGRVVNKEWLDRVVPNNSVIVASDFIPHPITASSTALKAIQESDPDPYMADLFNGMGQKGFNPSMAVSMRLYAGIQVIGARNFEAFKQSLKYVMLEIAKYGATSIAGRVDYPTDLAAEAELARTGQAPIRYGWSHHLMRRLLGTDSAPRAFSLVGDFNNIGTDLFWNIGVGAEGPPDLPFAHVLCTSARVKEEYSKVFSAGCGLLPGSQMREGIERMVANRVRVSGIHASADMTLDLLLDAVRGGMKSSGLTMEDVRKMRITFDHVLLARQDQIEKLKEFGMIPAPFISIRRTRSWTCSALKLKTGCF